MKILHCVYTIDPAIGGSFEAVRQFSLAHMGMGHDVEIASLDTPDKPYLQGFPIPVHPLGVNDTKYGFSPRYTPWLKENHSRFDVVLVNGIWQYNSYGAWKALRKASTPYFVFPHGFLSSWFKKTYPLKHLKKWLYWPWSDYRVLRDARATLFTCEEEVKRAAESFCLYKCRPRITPMGLKSPGGDPSEQCAAFFQRYPALQGRPFLLFLSRLCELKGCDHLIDAFGIVAREDPDLLLVVAGPGNKAYTDMLRSRLQSHGKEVASRVVWTGKLEGDPKWGAFRAADAFLFPSHTENFGMVVAEAIACGTPVLTTRGVGIWREVTEDGAGWAESDDTDGIVRLVRRWQALPASEREEMRLRARDCFERRFEIGQAARQLIEVLEEEMRE